MSQYNTVVAQIDKIVENRNGSVTLTGVVDQSIGADYRPGDELIVTVSRSSADSVTGKGKGAYLLEKVDPENQSCGFATFARSDVRMALIGPLLVSWKDDQGGSHIVTFDAGGIESKMDEVKDALRRYAKSLRVSRELIEIGENGSPASGYLVSAANVEHMAPGIIDENPSAQAFLIRNRERAVTARLHWDEGDGIRYFEWPRDKEGRPVSFHGDVEIIPVSRMDYLRNSFDPKKSTAYSVVNAMLNKSEKQLAYESKLYPSWDSLATGFVISRALPRGGETIEQTAISFPTLRRGDVPGEMPLEKQRQSNRTEMTRDSVHAFLRAFAAEFGIETDRVESFLAGWEKGNRSASAASRGEDRGTGSRENRAHGDTRTSGAANDEAESGATGRMASADDAGARERAASISGTTQGASGGERRQPPAVRPIFGSGRRR